MPYYKINSWEFMGSGSCDDHGCQKHWLNS